MIAEMFSRISRHLIIEFVDREDGRVEKLLNDMEERRSCFDFYCRENFERSFNEFFILEKREELPESHRTLYLMRSKTFIAANLSFE